MSEEEFLTRWSRRKREAQTALDAPPPTEAAEAPNQASSGMAETQVVAEVDISSLPPIESITGATDITAFLRKGVPPDLSRAALRRAWAADPAIRDFVGLAENAWDFNDPNAMPGFGPLECSAEQLAALLDRVVGGVGSVADRVANTHPEQDGLPSADCKPSLETRAPDATAELSPPAEDTSMEHGPSALVAVQPEGHQNPESGEISARRRTHGSALPR